MNPGVYTSSFGTKNQYSRFIRNNEAKNETMFRSKNVFWNKWQNPEQNHPGANIR